MGQLNLVETFQRLPSFEDIEVNRERFEQLENALLRMPQLEEEKWQLKEYVSGGMYCRQITIPKGVMLTGRIYKFDHIEIMVSGKIDILSADGGIKRYEGYNVIEAKAGKRQAGYAWEDTVWMTVNRVPEIPMEEMLDHTSVMSYEEYYAFHQAVNRHDFARFLDEIGMTQAQMDDIVQIDDLVPLPEEYDHIYTDFSTIEGKGLFSKVSFENEDIICPARINDRRTIGGRFANHAFHPNSEITEIEGVFYLRANRTIPANTEIVVNYRNVLDYRKSRGDL